MRRAAKVDANQSEIVAALRGLGFSVLHMHQLGKGVPDIAAGKAGHNWFFEIKDGSKLPSARKLTDDETMFHAMWRGHIEIIESVDDVLNFARRIEA